MSARIERGIDAPKIQEWRFVPLGLGLALMYLPSYLDVAKRFWGIEEESHGPIILMIVLWLLWRERTNLIRDSVRPIERIIGMLLFGIGILIYTIGRSQEFFQFDIGSQTLVIVGLALSLGGVSAARSYWFPAIFLLFLIPIPPSLLDQILVPLKVTVSKVVTDSLFVLGYPISRSGVMLVIGQYQLLIADACSGLRSMIALSGIGILYTYLLRRDGWLISGSLLLAAVPIAFLANVLRVATLVLVTYYFGADAGTDFHDLAGYFEIILAFAAFFVLDFLLVWSMRMGKRSARSADE